MSPSAASFQWPQFYHYPPYFTLQPIKETRDKQIALWCSLVLSYCKQQKVYLLSTSQETPLFHNTTINRRLQPEAVQTILGSLVAAGNALWLDAAKSRALILWKKLEEWADAISSWARDSGVSDTVVLVEDLRSGTDVAGTELAGLDREVLLRALKVLEGRGGRQGVPRGHTRGGGREVHVSQLQHVPLRGRGLHVEQQLQYSCCACSRAQAHAYASGTDVWAAAIYAGTPAHSRCLLQHLYSCSHCGMEVRLQQLAGLDQPYASVCCLQ